MILKWANKIQNQAGRQYQYENYKQPDNQVRVDYIPPTDKKNKSRTTVGDFVDYEEVK